MATYNVKDYGAFGNNDTDDAPKINSAIADINAVGGELYFPRGTYKIDSPLTAITADHVRFRGQHQPGILFEIKTQSAV